MRAEDWLTGHKLPNARGQGAAQPGRACACLTGDGA